MRVILCFMLALSTASASADWVKVAVAENGNTSYIDPTRVRKDGTFRKVWEIYDLKQRNKDGVMSFRFLMMYDCKDERFRFLSISTHSEPMAGGDLLLSDNSLSDWNYVPPGSLVETKYNFACSN